MNTDHLSASTESTRLLEVSQQKIKVARPFNPRTTLHKPSHFPSPFDYTGPGEYLFITRVERQLIGGRVTYPEGGNEVVLHVYVPETNQPICNLKAIENELTRRLGLDLDIEAFEELWKHDSILSGLPDDMLGARPSSPFSLYEFLVICTILQNTTVRRTVQMANALAHEFGSPFQFPEGVVLYGFWEPVNLIDAGENRLRELRLGYRAKTLIRLSKQFVDLPIFESALLGLRDDPDQLLKQIISLYGVGPASAGYIMFEWFKRVNEFTHVSPWERKILSKLLFGNADSGADVVLQFCHDRWKPYTMLAVHALFESIFWQRVLGQGPEWLDELIRL